MPDNVTYLPATVEAALSPPPGTPYAPLSALGPFDLLVCDMNIDPRPASRIIISLCPLLSPSALLIFTIKLVAGFHSRKDREQQCEETIKCLEPHFETLKIYWLLANSNERTLLARKRPT
jgi:hypothetical protein